MSNYSHKTGIIYLDFVEISKDGAYVYHNPTLDSSKTKLKNDDAKTIFEEVFGKKK